MSVWNNFVAGVKDVTNLEVQTYTGNITGVITNDPEKGDLINWKQLLTQAKTEGSKITLVGATNIDADQDVTQYLDASAPPQVVSLHLDAVKSSQETRVAFLKMIKDLL